MSVVEERIAALEKHNDCWIKEYTNGQARGFYLTGTIFCASCPDRVLLPTDCKGTCVTGGCTSKYAHYCPCMYPPEGERLAQFMEWAEAHERIIASQREVAQHSKRHVPTFPGNRLTSEGISGTLVA